MNRHVTIGFCGILSLLAFSNPAKRITQPFQAMEQHVEKAWGGWHGDARILAKLFNEERERLGDRFDKSLIEYVGEIPDKHIVIPRFLVFPSYLKKQKPRPYLALLLWQQGIEVSSRSTDEDSQAKVLQCSVAAAVLSHKMGFKSLAQGHKRRAEMLLASKPKLFGAWPALSKDDRKAYDSIVARRKRKRKEKQETRPATAPSANPEMPNLDTDGTGG